MTISQKKKHFSSQPPKKHYFSGFFLKFSFSIFSCFLFFFFQHKKDKNRKCTFFFENPFFDTLTNCQKIFSHTYRLFVLFLRYPKNTIKLGKKQAKKNLGPSFDATLDQALTQKPQILDQVLTLQHIYIYICWRVTFCTTFLPSEELEAVPPFLNVSFYSSHKQIKS